MGPVLIRNLDEALIENYRRSVLADRRPKRKLSGEELIALSRRLRDATPDSAEAIDSTDLIREDRDTR